MRFVSAVIVAALKEWKTCWSSGHILERRDSYCDLSRVSLITCFLFAFFLVLLRCRCDTLGVTSCCFHLFVAAMLPTHICCAERGSSRDISESAVLFAFWVTHFQFILSAWNSGILSRGMKLLSWFLIQADAPSPIPPFPATLCPLLA